MCDDKIKNLAINVPLRKTKLLTTKQRSGPYQVLIININFLLCVLVWYNQEFHEEYSQTWSCSIKEAFFRSLETSFVKALYQISVSFYMTHYLIGASRALAFGGSLCEYSSLSLLLTAEDVSREIRLRLAPKIRYWWRRYVRNLVNGHWLVDVHI